MNRILLQGRAPTLRDQHRVNFARPGRYSVVDFDSLRVDINSRVFVGPPTPLEFRPQFSPDAESKRYWRLVDDFQRYGYCEVELHGTPSFCSHMGY